MSTLVRLFLLLCLLGAGSLSAATKQWAQLKVGISARQTVVLLGKPMFLRHGKGFETWTYDQGGEVLLYGGNAVVGWTAPASANLTVRSSDVWSLQPDDHSYATLYSLFETADIVPASLRAPKPEPKRLPVNTGETGYEQYYRDRKG